MSPSTESSGLPRLHLLTHDGLLADESFGRRAAALLERGEGRVGLHLRGPHTSGRRLHQLGVELLDCARGSGSRLFVNDRVDVAMALRSGAGKSGPDPGVHLGERSLPLDVTRRLLGAGPLVGRSIHPGGETSGEGLDYLMVGTMYRTTSHPGRRPAGPEWLRTVARDTRRPLLGVGGVTPERVSELLEAGAFGVAVIRGIWDALDPPGAMDEYLEALGTA